MKNFNAKLVMHQESHWLTNRLIEARWFRMRGLLQKFELTKFLVMLRFKFNLNCIIWKKNTKKLM